MVDKPSALTGAAGALGGEGLSGEQIDGKGVPGSLLHRMAGTPSQGSALC